MTTPGGRSGGGPRRSVLGISAFRCPSCRYDLTENVRAMPEPVRGDTEIMCSECGERTTGLAATSVGAENRGWGYFLLWLSAVGVVLLLLGSCGSVVLYVLLNATAGSP